MNKIHQSVSKQFFIGLTLLISTLLSVLMMFYIQFSVENLQDQIIATKNQIFDHEDQLRLLEVEWVYLTRPERLRQLSSNYLKNNGYVLVSQVIDRESGDLEDLPNIDQKSIKQANLKNIENKIDVVLSSSL